MAGSSDSSRQPRVLQVALRFELTGRFELWQARGVLSIGSFGGHLPIVQAGCVLRIQRQIIEKYSNFDAKQR